MRDSKELCDLLKSIVFELGKSVLKVCCVLSSGIRTRLRSFGIRSVKGIMNGCVDPPIVHMISSTQRELQVMHSAPRLQSRIVLHMC